MQTFNLDMTINATHLGSASVVYMNGKVDSHIPRLLQLQLTWIYSWKIATCDELQSLELSQWLLPHR